MNSNSNVKIEVFLQSAALWGLGANYLGIATEQASSLVHQQKLVHMF
jgi:hypothetical protein